MKVIDNKADKPKAVGFLYPPQKHLTPTKQDIYNTVDTVKDTAKEPVLQNYGGDLSRRWYITHYTGNKRQRTWIKSKPLKTRQERAVQLLKELQQNKGIGINLQAVLNAVVDSQNLRPKTKQSYKSDIKVLQTWISKEQISSIESLQLNAENFYNYLDTKYSDRTKKNKINTLKCCFNEAFKQKYIGINPLSELKPKYHLNDSENSQPYSEYEREQIESYLIKNNYQLYIFTRFIFYSFIRPKELINLKVSDINIRTRTIRVHKSISKNKRTENVPILKPLLELIIESGILKNYGNKYIFGSGLQVSEHKAASNEANNEHRKAIKALGIYRERQTVLYSWKHTGNICAYLANIDLKTIQLINRHRSIATTEIYLRKLGLFLDQKVLDIEY